MAVAASNKFSDNTATGATSFATQSWTPTANRLNFLCFYSRTGISADPTQPTASGNSLTWNLAGSVVFDSTGSSRRRLTAFWALGASPSTGATTIDCGGQAQTGAAWIVDDFTGIDTASPVVQTVTNKDEGVSQTSLTVTLAAFGSANNATYGFFATATNAQTPTVGSGFTLVDEETSNAIEVAAKIDTEFRSDNDTSVDMSWSANSQFGGIAVEIKAATDAGGTVTATAYMTTNKFWGT